MKNRNRILALLAAILLLACTACSAPAQQEEVTPAPTEAEAEATPEQTETEAPEQHYTPGTYTAVGSGNNGDVVVSVTFSEDAITEVTVDSHNETSGIGDVAVERLPGRIVEKQSLMVNAISGATNTSKAILEAVEACAVQAGGNIDALKVPLPEEPTPEIGPNDNVVDVVVVGGGGAGMTAAIKVMEAGKSVVLLEKMAVLGGNTAMATTAYYAAGSYTQKEKGLDVTADDMYEWLLSFGEKMDPAACRVIADRSGEAINWMIDMGADFGDVYDRFKHRQTNGGAPGVTIVKTLTEKMDELGLDYRTENKATEIVLEDGKIAGVKVSSPEGDYVLHSKAVILTAGGFAANQEMLAQYDERWATLGCSSSPGQNGDGILMAQAIGADVVDMDNIKINPTVLYYSEDKLVSMSTLRSNGGIMVNREGKRFTNENGNYTVEATEVLKQTGGSAFMVFDSKMLDIALMQKYNEAGYFTEAETLEELAEKMGIDPEGLVAEVEHYKTFVANGKDEDFGRSNLGIDFERPNYYAVEIKPAAQGTFGGLRVNTSAQVIDTQGEVIDGLYAAGENAGEGTQGNAPLVSNTVYGTLAAESAVAFIDSLN